MRPKQSSLQVVTFSENSGKMPSFCKTHFIFYRQPRCPKCLAAEASLQGYAGIPALQGRWGQLRANPDTLNQDQFGVCGTTSIVYLLLWYQFARARELYKAALADIDPNFTGSVFTSAGHQVIAVQFKYLSSRYRLREQYAPAVPNPAGPGLGLVPASVINTPLFLDYLLSRALGYAFKKVAKNRYDGEKMDFNMEFDPQNLGNYRNFTRYGNLALRTNNLAFILHEIVGAQNVHIVHKQGGPVRPVPLAPAVAGVATTNITTVAQLQLEFNNRLALPKSFAIAAIYADIVFNGQIAVSSPTAAAGGDSRGLQPLDRDQQLHSRRLRGRWRRRLHWRCRSGNLDLGEQLERQNLSKPCLILYRGRSFRALLTLA